LIFPLDKGPDRISKKIRSLYKGFHEACVEWNFPIIGGNLSKGPCFIIDITLIGRAEENDRLLLRNGVKKGDDLWVTGCPGQSAAGLSALQKWGSFGNIPRNYRSLVSLHKRPVPRIEMGRQLAKNTRVHAMIDISDGMAKECHTLAFDNNLGIMLGPLDPRFLDPLKEMSERLHRNPLDWFLSGGEDYELLFSASAAFDPEPFRKMRDVPLTRIGTFNSTVKGVQLKLNNDTIINVEKTGWDNLSNPAKPDKSLSAGMSYTKSVDNSATVTKGLAYKVF
jgi:thiamine-monophosphate kinase